MEDKKREDEAEEIRQLNELLEDHGIVITEKVKWSPGDPVTNTGEAMLHADWEAYLQENHPDLYSHYIRDPKFFWESYDAVLLELLFQRMRNLLTHDKPVIFFSAAPNFG